MNRQLKKGGWLIAAAMVLGLGSGCEINAEFRDVAVPSLQSGVSLILDGLVDGMFAVIDPGTTTATTTGGS